MKKIVSVVLVLLLTLGLAGCSSKDKNESVNPVELSTREIEQMPDYIEGFLTDLKTTENYGAFKVDDGLLVFASLGEKSTAGYAINFAKGGIKDDTLFVEVNITDPQGSDVAQVITYPYALVKVLGEDLPDKVIFVEGTDYSKVIKEVNVSEIPQMAESVIGLYFGTKDGYLRKELRSISGLPDPERGKEIIEELIKGSQAQDDTLNVLPEGTKVLDYKFDHETGLAQINLSEHVHGVTGSMGETLAVYGIVNTLTDLPEIKEVKILVEGKEVESLAGHIYLGEPLERDLELLEGNMLK